MDTAYRVSPLRSRDPDWLGEYQLVGRLGSGGMGVVYLAESDDGSYVAIKLIHADLASDPEFSGRFRSEVERARQVPSFCTAEFLAADLDHDPPYLVVEYVDGPSLDEVVAERGPLRGGALHSLAVGVATALTGIHGAGVIHRDLKPDNVLLPPGSPKVIDFGIARPFEATSQHTQTDVMVGTVPYMAPERFSVEPGTPVTAAADVFAWGCVIGFAGTGRTPFLGDSPSATAARILTQPPHLDGLPESLRDLVLLALSKDPADRPTAAELLAMLLGEKPVPRPAATDGDGAVRDGAVRDGAGRDGVGRDGVGRDGVGRDGAGRDGAVRAGAGRAGADWDDAGGNSAGQAVAATSGRAGRRNRGGRVLLVTLAALLVLAGLTIVGLVVNGRNTPVTGRGVDSTPAVAYVASSPAVAPASTASAPSGPSPTVSPSAPSPSPSRSATVRPSGKPLASGVQASVNASGRNLALGKTANASSDEGPAWAASRAVDGDLQSRWSSGFSDPQWLSVDLGAQWQISRVVLHWEFAFAVSYRVEISADDRTWKTVFSTSVGGGGDVTVTTDTVSGRYVRMYGTQRNGNYGYSLYEMEVR